MKEISKISAIKMLEEYRKIQDMNFWEYLMDAYEKERTDAREDWELTDVGNIHQPLIEKWIRYQVRAKSFRDATRIPEDLKKKLEDILRKNE